MSKEKLNIDSIKKIQALVATLSAEELKELKSKALPKIKKTIVKWNKSGGIFFTAPGMESTSKNGKEYQAGINIPAHNVKGLLYVLRNPQLVEDIVTVIRTGKDIERELVVS